MVVGNTGQVGRELTRAAWPQGVELVSAGRADLDITDAASVRGFFAAAAPDLVINATANTAVDRSESEPEAAFAVNAEAPRHMAEAAGERGIPLIHYSTDYVFDGSKAGAWTEEDAVNPLGVYGASKEAGERAVRAAQPRHAILRTAWVYSAFGHNFAKTMLRVGAERDELRVVADQHGCPTAAAEIARATVPVAMRFLTGEDAPWGTYHLAGAGATTWHGFAERIFDLAAPALGRRPVVHAIATADYPTPTRRPANSVLDCTKLERTFGVRLRPWEEPVAEVVAELTAAMPVRA
nr:dTDP-4-dehydrorhamnose reductase [Azospirillum sp. SYSU D00513]